MKNCRITFLMTLGWCIGQPFLTLVLFVVVYYSQRSNFLRSPVIPQKERQEKKKNRCALSWVKSTLCLCWAHMRKRKYKNIGELGIWGIGFWFYVGILFMLIIPSSMMNEFLYAFSIVHTPTYHSQFFSLSKW